MAPSRTPPMPLAEGFPPAGEAAWRAEVRRVLGRGRGELDDAAFEALFAKVLETPTYEGLTLRPLYTAADAPPAGSEGLPGLPPFTRGGLPRPPAGRWDARQTVVVSGDGSGAAGRAVHELENGAASVLLDLHGADAIDAALLDRTLEGVRLDAAAVGLAAGGRAIAAAGALRALWDERGVADDEAAASLGIDPIGRHAITGGADDVDDALSRAAALAAEIDGRHPRVRSLLADAAPYHDAGASDAQQIACAVATGIEYLRALTGAGMPIDRALGQVELRLAADARQFPVIASLRATRRIWSRVAEACGAAPASGAARLHAVTSRAMATRYDPWVNLLRGTVACLAAGLGGAEVVTVAPYDDALGTDAALGRRLARNTQSLLLDESGLGRVADPAGGSWFVEALTEGLAAEAWRRLQGIERAGGMRAALDAGAVQEEIDGTWAARRKAVATRRDPITGVSEFPDIDEDPPGATAPAGAPSGTPVPPVALRRRAAPFEDARGRADRHAARHGARPVVLLACLGPLAEHAARAGFAANLFAAGGIRPAQSEPLSSGEDAARALAHAGAALACICGTDAAYAEHAEDVARALAGAGAARVLLAGAPGGREGALRTAGVDAFAHLGCDAVELLVACLDAAGVDP